MTRKKTLKKQKFSFNDMIEIKVKDSSGIRERHPEKVFLDAQKVSLALLECLIDNDTEAFIEILDAYLMVNRSQIAKKAKMPRSTVQLALSKRGNPTLKTIAKIVHESSVGQSRRA